MKDEQPGSNQPSSARVVTAADWYDEYYRVEQVGLSPWYRILLPELKRTVRPTTQLVELGCGQAQILRTLAGARILPEENITGVDQSKSAIDFCTKKLPKAKFLIVDLYHLGELPSGGFDICLLMETIEHLEHPIKALANIHRILKPGGLLYLSFPNFLHVPWLLVRVLAEKLNRPNWIVLQPTDKIYTVFGVRRLVTRGGFEFLKGIGSGYAPPVLYRWETDGIAHLLNLLRLWRFSFHPILVFRRPSR